MRAIRQCARVFLPAQFFELIENWAKNVGVVIGNDSGKIGQILRALNDRRRTLKTHSGINVTRRERDVIGPAGLTAPGYRLRVELDEDQVPNLHATRVFLVHERAARVAIGRKVDMHFRAWAARAGVAHHPEIVRLAATQNVNRWIQIGLTK